MSNHWLLNTSFAYNSTIVHMDGWPGDSAWGLQFIGTPFFGFAEDPTNRSTRNGFQYDYVTSGSGLGNVYVNAKWLYKLSGLVNLPYDVNVSGFYNARQGYPLELAIQGPSRPNGGGIPTVLLNPVGETRLPNYQNLDLHIDRPIGLARVRLVPSLDLFNVFNTSIVQAFRTTQNAANANNIQAVVAPRVLRVGVKVNWQRRALARVSWPAVKIKDGASG
jgi:hypothetical protein